MHVSHYHQPGSKCKLRPQNSRGAEPNPGGAESSKPGPDPRFPGLNSLPGINNKTVGGMPGLEIMAGTGVF